MDAEERHWTEDSDLIERFVLNRLDPDERNELEDHLRICEVCKQAVRAEQLLLAGIRRSGRERFKAALAQKLSAVEQRRVPWAHLLSAAAVVLIVISVVLYNRWFEIVTTPNVESDTQRPKITSREEPARTHPLEHIQPGVQEQSTPIGEEKQEGLPHNARRTKPNKGLADGPKRVAPRDERSSEGDAQAPMAQAEALPSQRMTLSAIAPAEIWLEGQIVDSAADMLNAPAGEEAPAQLYKAERKDAVQRAYDSQRISVPRPRLFHLRQELLASLPASQRKAPPEAATITTSFRLRGDTTYVTLYPDTLMDASILERALIEMPADDSLVVSLPDRRIIYRLPNDWNVQPPAK